MRVGWLRASGVTLKHNHLKCPSQSSDPENSLELPLPTDVRFAKPAWTQRVLNSNGHRPSGRLTAAQAGLCLDTSKSSTLTAAGTYILRADRGAAF